jgi:hypothetical protein
MWGRTFDRALVEEYARPLFELIESLRREGAEVPIRQIVDLASRQLRERSDYMFPYEMFVDKFLRPRVSDSEMTGRVPKPTSPKK